MKIKPGTIIYILLAFLWSVFMGVTAISMGVGSLFPAGNMIAKPFVCPRGEMELSLSNYTVSPVESGSLINWYCVDSRTGVKTEINPFAINLFAGGIYGVLLFAMILVLWYFYSRWDPSKENEQTKEWIGWIQIALVILCILGTTLFNLLPLFRSPGATPEPISAPDAAATAREPTFEALRSGAPVAFSSTEQPLVSWNDIPILPEAVAGEQVSHGTYTFDVPVDSGTISSFYKDKLKSLGWYLEEDQDLGMKFTKGNSLLWLTLAPATDEESWVVTLSLNP